MWFFGIIPDEVFHQFLIKDSGLIKVIYMPVDKLLLDSPVESLQISVRFRVLRIIKEVHQAIILARLGKVFFKFTTVISLDSLSGKGGNLEEVTQKITAMSRGIGFIGVGEGKARADVNGGKDIALDASSKDRDGIHLNKVARLLGHKAFSHKQRARSKDLTAGYRTGLTGPVP